MSKNADATQGQAGRPTESGTVTLLLGRERFENLERIRATENTTTHALIVKALAYYCKAEHGETF
jgi:hypothetical protein